jgi:hypothetical protein
MAGLFKNNPSEIFNPLDKYVEAVEKNEKLYQELLKLNVRRCPAGRNAGREEVGDVYTRAVIRRKILHFSPVGVICS